ncbi:MAG: hypothetical protein Q8R15_02165 [Candidatus Micrarchaeota archaeon]|nr:hypothetical protein [Candidatus Micrarchaeota archaeon]
MPEETDRQILAAIQTKTSGAKLTANRRGVTFKTTATPAYTIIEQAHQIALRRGHSVKPNENRATQEHTLNVVTRRALEKREAKQRG